MGKSLRLGIAGLGTVGAGVLDLLATHADLLASRAGIPIEIAAVSARDRSKRRNRDLSRFDWFDDPRELEPARQLLAAFLRRFGVLHRVRDEVTRHGDRLVAARSQRR